jgi:hypothetical protein
MDFGERRDRVVETTREFAWVVAGETFCDISGGIEGRVMDLIAESEIVRDLTGGSFCL